MIENPTKTPEGTPQGTPIEVGKETCPTKTPKGIDAQNKFSQRGNRRTNRYHKHKTIDKRLKESSKSQHSTQKNPSKHIDLNKKFQTPWKTYTSHIVQF